MRLPEIPTGWPRAMALPFIVGLGHQLSLVHAVLLHQLG